MFSLVFGCFLYLLVTPHSVFVSLPTSLFDQQVAAVGPNARYRLCAKAANRRQVIRPAVQAPFRHAWQVFRTASRVVTVHPRFCAVAKPSSLCCYSDVSSPVGVLRNLPGSGSRAQIDINKKLRLLLGQGPPRRSPKRHAEVTV